MFLLVIRVLLVNYARDVVYKKGRVWNSEKALMHAALILKIGDDLNVFYFLFSLSVVNGANKL